jgi:hypothetical protein
MKYLINAVTFIPNNQPVTLTDTSPIGWYVLYPPQDVRGDQSPSLIHFDPALPNYLGWTTITPVGCNSPVNYNTGKCSLLYQRLNDIRNQKKDINSGQEALPVGKGIQGFIGRILSKNAYPYVSSSENFCLTLNFTNCFNQKPPLTPADFQNWSIGFITYFKTLANSQIATSVFGQLVKGYIRDIGQFKTYTDALTPHRIVQNSVELPTVETGQPIIPNDYLYYARVLTFNSLDTPSEIQIIFPEDIYGSVPDSPGRYLTMTGNQINIKGSEAQFTVDLNNLVFLNTVSEFNIYIGNQKFTQVF